MTVEVLVLMLLKAQVAASGAVLLVLLLRLPARRLIGAELAYGLWALVPAAAVASLFPTLPQCFGAVGEGGGEAALRSGPFLDWGMLGDHAQLLGRFWLIGAGALFLLFALGEWRFHLKVRAGTAGPAVTGAWLRMVVPHDYEQRFTAAERVLIREHERAHMARQDPRANLLIAALQVLGWFNPLSHLAAACARLDQELACDARVVARHPRRRREYAETLLKAHLRGLGSPLACALSLGRKHPLEVRMAMLATPRISVRRDLIGAFAVGALAVGIAAALWMLGPL